MTDNKSFEEASQAAEGGLFADLIGFMSENAKWWLIPIICVLGLLGALVILGGTGGALPFIYALF